MKIYTFTQAREHLAAVLEEASRHEVVIKRRNGDQFSIVPKRPALSPCDVPPVRTQAMPEDILDAIRDSRERE